MTTRERNLATILIAVVGVLGVAALANAVFLQPFNNLRSEIEKADQQLEQRRDEIAAEQNRIARIEQLNPRLAQWEKLSLPQGDTKPEAFKAHLIKLRREYQRYLTKVLTDSGFKVNVVLVDGPIPGRVLDVSPCGRQPLGSVITLKVVKDADGGFPTGFPTAPATGGGAGDQPSNGPSGGVTCKPGETLLGGICTPGLSSQTP